MVANGSDAALADVSLSGLPGWVSVSAPLATGRITLRVWVPRGSEAFVRPPLPAGPGSLASSSQRTMAQPQQAAPYAVCSSLAADHCTMMPLGCLVADSSSQSSLIYAQYASVPS